MCSGSRGSFQVGSFLCVLRGVGILFDFYYDLLLPCGEQLECAYVDVSVCASLRFGFLVGCAGRGRGRCGMNVKYRRCIGGAFGMITV